MEERTQKLIVFAGEEGSHVQARDFKKLSQVIVNQYLTQGNPNYRNYLIQILTKAVRNIPLKAHLYAGLTVSISRTYPELAIKILQNIIAHLQTDLCAGNFTQVLNSLNYLSQSMNVSFLNSLNYMNLLQDLLQAAEKQPELWTRKSLVSTLIKALPLYAYSLFQKTCHQFKKYIQKLSKQSEGDELFAYLYQQYSNNNLINYSAMKRLGHDFTQVMQHNGKLRLILDLKNAKNKDLNQGSNQLYKWDTSNHTQEYELYRKGQGLIVRMWLQQIIVAFSTSSNTLLTKFYNLISHISGHIQIRYILQTLILRSLRTKSSMSEYFLLLSLKNTQGLQQHSKIVQQVLFEYFNQAQQFQLSMLVSFSKLFVFIVNNAKQEVDISKLIENQEMFMKRNVLIKLILEKLTLLNDKFKCPSVLVPFENSKPFNSQEEFKLEEKDVFQGFDAELKKKSNAGVIGSMINTEREYQIFLEALFRRTCLSHTHLTILSERYSQILMKFKDWDWDLVNKIRNFFRNSFFHRLLYFRFMINEKYLSFSSYINYVGGLKDKSELEMLWIKVELNELNSQFGKSLKNK